jgi:hypothetical protein
VAPLSPVNQYRMVTVDSATPVVPLLTSVSPGLIWLSFGPDGSLLRYRAVSPVGGGVPAGVVTLTAFDAAEALPAASLAFTVNEYIVDGDRPETVAEVPATVVARALPRNTSYAVTPTLSVEADQDRDTVDGVVAVTARFAGADGGCVSPVATGVVALAALEAAELFPAASRALTVNE